MPSLEEFSHTRIGGIPAPALALVVSAAAVLGYSVLKGRRTAAASASTDTGAGTFDQSSIDPNTGLPYDAAGQYGLPNIDPSSSAFPVGLPEQGLPGPTTNAQWARLAGDSLIAKGDDPTLVENALFKFINGQPLTQAEEAIKNLAVQLFGIPPEGVAPITLAPPPSVVPPVLQPNPRSATYIVHSGDNLTSIASRYHVAEGTLYSLNATAIENAAKAHKKASSRGGPHNALGWWIYPGTRLTIPLAG